MASDEAESPGIWVYSALRTFELLGLVNLDPTIPYTREEIEFYLDRILTGIKKKDTELSARQQFLLDRLREEYQGKSSRPGRREDPPVYFYREGNRFFAVDFTAGGAFRKRVDDKKGEANGLLIPGILIDLGWRMTIETSYRVRMEPERGLNVSRHKPGERLRSYRGVTMEYERAYLSLRGTRWKISLGRDYLHWGNGREEGLLMSRTAGSLDRLSMVIGIGRFKLSAFHAVLDSEFPRYLAGHRLTIGLPHGIYLGLGETVLYTGRGLDFAYLLPVCSYYANQFNEGGDDNILWALDWKVPLRRGLILYGELLIDDFQYEGSPPAPDRVGVNLTAEALCAFGGMEIELLAGYTYIDIYTYAHRDTFLTRYVTGDGESASNNLIGSSLGPDADRWNFKASVPVHPRVVIAAEGRISRYGDGKDLREWYEGMDPHPSFPSGHVVKEKEISLDSTADLGRGSTIKAGGGWRVLSGGEEDRKDGFAYLELLLDF